MKVIGGEGGDALAPCERDCDWMSNHLGLHPRTFIRELRFYRCSFGTNCVVFQYEPADGAAPQPRNSDIGGHHIAFYVDDFDVALSYLREQGVEIMGETTVARGARAGQRWGYFRCPGGM